MKTKVTKVTIIKYVLITVSIILNFMFYSTMSIFFMILGVSFDVVKSEMFSIGFKRKNNIIVAISFIPVLISIFATMGNFNNYTKMETEQTIREEYKQHQQLIKRQESIVNKAQQDLDSMPTLDEYKGDISSNHSTNLTKITKEYNDLNTQKTNTLNEANKKLVEIESKKIEKFEVKEVGEKKGYRLLFENISKTINVDITTLILIMGLIFAVTLETFIIILTYNDVPDEKSQEEILKDAIEQISSESISSLVNQIRTLNESSNESSSSNEKFELQSSSSSSNSELQSSNRTSSSSSNEDQVRIKKLKSKEFEDLNKVRKVANKEDIQSLNFESSNEKVKIDESSSSSSNKSPSSSSNRTSSSSSSSNKKSELQNLNSKIGFELQNPKIEKIKKYLIEHKMQGKQFPTAKLALHLDIKRHHIDNIKQELIEADIIYKANSRSYKVKEDL